MFVRGCEKDGEASVMNEGTDRVPTYRPAGSIGEMA